MKTPKVPPSGTSTGKWPSDINQVGLVLYFKKNMLINKNVTNAANPEDCNISNHGPLEQKPGREHGLTVLLCESFYVC